MWSLVRDVVLVSIITAVISVALFHYAGFQKPAGGTLQQMEANEDPVVRPQPAPATASREMVFNAAPNGHFFVDAAVNGENVRFMVDTGATMVVLSPEDARRIGIPRGMLRFTLSARTANGVVRAAPVTLRQLRIGQFVEYDVPAAVNEAPIGISLLGTDFLNRLDGYEVNRGRLIMRW
ncbi:MAG: TIGR02281 family clan AA aspartic protease [Alphaproteobacteria bacterium]